jgi:hypothetical protein
VNLVIEGMAEGFFITDGFGDTSDEPPAFTIPGNAILGDDEGGLTADAENDRLDSSDSE